MMRPFRECGIRTRVWHQDESDVQLARKILTWLTYSLRPLRVTELQHALALEPEDTFLDEDALPDEGLLISLCAGLVAIDKESDIIRLVHHTTQEYFERSRMDLFPDGHREIAHTCLTYLSLEKFATPFDKGSAAWDKHLEDDAFLGYAA